jgi:hypothetical protein
VGHEAARNVGVHCAHDLFGGVVPHAFVATKLLTHPLLQAGSAAPEGWSGRFAQQTEDAVLPGYSVFAKQDARAAAERLLGQSPVRIKQPGGIGGLGQSVITCMADLDALLASFDPDELEREGLVVEQNLNQVTTLSVGQIMIGTLLATYCGTQRLTINHRGKEVYGGSDLLVVRGGFDVLQRLDMDEATRTAVTQACRYHEAALSCYSGMYVSRSNYDILQGVDEQGRWRSGVLEQSWRIGGATGAELAAVEAFQADPGLEQVAASTIEIYEEDPSVPPDAAIMFSGVDQHVGPLTKYSRLERNANP